MCIYIRTFDFSTLYTKIPHHLLRDALFEIVDFCFKGGISHEVYMTKADVLFGENHQRIIGCIPKSQ